MGKKHCEVMFNPLGAWQDDFEHYHSRGFLGDCNIYDQEMVVRLFLQGSQVRDVMGLLCILESDAKKESEFFFSLGLGDLIKDKANMGLSSKILCADFWDRRSIPDEQL